MRKIVGKQLFKAWKRLREQYLKIWTLFEKKFEHFLKTSSCNIWSTTEAWYQGWSIWEILPISYRPLNFFWPCNWSIIPVKSTKYVWAHRAHRLSGTIELVKTPVFEYVDQESHKSCDFTVLCRAWSYARSLVNCATDNLHKRLTSDLGKKIKSFCYIQKEDPKISTIAKLWWWNVVKYRKYSPAWEVCEFCIYLYYAGKSHHFRGNFSSKMETFSARNTNIYKICKLYRAIFSVFYNISPPNFAILLIFRSSF